ncbi:MAG: 2-oxoglutarate dehydrogenase E1 component [Gemmatimonadetes bacterium]|nr:2-oxoglutarate dehydrogenase E1 component [Gemmatimonadota bacterium]
MRRRRLARGLARAVRAVARARAAVAPREPRAGAGQRIRRHLHSRGRTGRRRDRGARRARARPGDREASPGCSSRRRARQQRKRTVEISRTFGTYNAGYAQAVYQQYLLNPASVPEEWRRYFEATGGAAPEAPAPPGAAPAAGAAPTAAQLRLAIVAAELVDAYRLHGHLIARVNPLGNDALTDKLLDPAFYGITPEELAAVPAAALGFEGGGTGAAVLEWLRRTYAGPIGYEYEHIADPERREWLRQQIESGAHFRPLSAEEKRRLLKRLTALEALEQFLHRAYLGQKRFSGEGTDMLVPMLDVAIERAAAAGAREVILGMAHRGRLNVLAHILGMPYSRIIGEFEGVHRFHEGTGDVKYHIGGEGTYATASGQPLSVVLAPNPSHLEFVNPVVEGMVRAKQSDLTGRTIRRDEDAVLAILMHGDASFAGQGVVAETLNLVELAGYRTGGTLHIITNNQIGFTTEPSAGRSTRYSSDIAKGFDIPIFHVNADEPEACLAVARLAMEYRERFHTDVLIDLIGYRRYGHNEGDEPAYTQPLMYEAIAKHPSVRRIFADRLVAEGIVTPAEVEAEWEAAHQRLVEAQEEVKKSPPQHYVPNGGPPIAVVERPAVDTSVDRELLLSLDRQLHSWPSDFHVHPKLARQLERRAKVLAADGPIDWAHAEALAFGSLLAEGRPVRLTGQDVERGTFSQRHLVLHDVETGRTYTPIANLAEAKAPFEVYNSPLSELAPVGFEYGFSVAVPDALVLWEAQFGDFANGAQVMIDQFIAAGRVKWGQESRLVLLLPHGAEGQGPEHSSARIERFLQLAAEGEMTVADCSTPANYFHLLRRQALSPLRRPLVVMTPKSLLRHPKAVSHLAELTDGRFQPVIDDAEALTRADEIRRVIVCTGKVYYDLIGSEYREQARDIAIVRLEELYPFPQAELTEVLGHYPAMEELVWTQEEPHNMGAWPLLDMRLLDVTPEGVRLAYVGRPERAAPAEGFANAQAGEQARLVKAAFQPLPPTEPSRKGRAASRRPSKR